MPDGSSTPAVWEKSVFVTGQFGEELQLMRIDVITGKPVWTEVVGVADPPKAGFKGIHPQAGPSPVTDGKRVVVSFANGDLLAYDFTGKKLLAAESAG